jgi:geranylgeranyl reductase
MISIIGAGPAGSYLASLLDGNVNIFDYKEDIGKPIQCTGVLTNKFQSYIKEKRFIDNKIYNIELNSKNNKHVIKLKKPEFIIDRHKYDNYLLEKAINKGVKFYPKHMLKNFSKNKIYFTNSKSYNTDIIVGADGPVSKVNKIAGIQNKRYWIAKQIKVKYKTDPNTYKVFFNVPDFFSWVVPENESIARIGCASSKNVNSYFQSLMKKLKVNEKNIIEQQGALIPQYNPLQKYSKNNVYLIGDAASQIKNISGGGLLPSIKAGNALANTLNKDKNYYSELSNLRKTLNLNYFTRKFLNNLTEKDYDQLIELLKQYKLDKLDRDDLNISDFTKPKLIMFSIRTIMRKFS